MPGPDQAYCIPGADEATAVTWETTQVSLPETETLTAGLAVFSVTATIAVPTQPFCSFSTCTLQFPDCPAWIAEAFPPMDWLPGSFQA